MSAAVAKSSSGLSPHVRGNRDLDFVRVALDGSIPARAGEPRRRVQGRRPGRVYPRTCGGTPLKEDDHGPDAGLSPHVRGNRAHGVRAVSNRGSIPARAGEPACGAGLGGLFQVYPRTCGGTYDVRRQPVPGWGLSPHVRGNRAISSRKRLSSGSIPARAGEPLAVVYTSLLSHRPEL